MGRSVPPTAVIQTINFTAARTTGHGTLLSVDVALLQKMECDLLLRPFALHATMAVETRRQNF